MKQITLILLILTFTISLSAQNKRSTIKTFSKFKTFKKVVAKKKIFSLGVLNSRALNLVKPKLPSFRVKGTVSVAIIIDENGKVIKALAYSGHPFLKAVSLKAALESTFKPYELSGKPITVQGLIVYNFVSDNYNWLEIGNAFGNQRFAEILDNNFTEEKQLYEQYKTADYENRIPILHTLLSTIESKLSNEPKKLWLFQTGILLKELQSNCCREENLKQKITELKTLLLNVPQNISKYLIQKLENIVYLSENPQLNTYDSNKGNKINKQLDNILERLSMLGN